MGTVARRGTRLLLGRGAGDHTGTLGPAKSPRATLRGEPTEDLRRRPGVDSGADACPRGADSHTHQARPAICCCAASGVRAAVPGKRLAQAAARVARLRRTTAAGVARPREEAIAAVRHHDHAERDEQRANRRKKGHRNPQGKPASGFECSPLPVLPVVDTSPGSFTLSVNVSDSVSDGVASA